MVRSLYKLKDVQYGSFTQEPVFYNLKFKAIKLSSNLLPTITSINEEDLQFQQA